MLASGGRYTREQGVAPGNRAFELQHYHATRTAIRVRSSRWSTATIATASTETIAREPVQYRERVYAPMTPLGERCGGEVGAAAASPQPTARHTTMKAQNARGRGAGMTQRQYKWGQRLTTCEKIIIQNIRASCQWTQKYYYIVFKP